MKGGPIKASRKDSINCLLFIEPKKEKEMKRKYLFLTQNYNFGFSKFVLKDKYYFSLFLLTLLVDLSQYNRFRI